MIEDERVIEAVKEAFKVFYASQAELTLRDRLKLQSEITSVELAELTAQLLIRQEVYSSGCALRGIEAQRPNYSIKKDVVGLSQFRNSWIEIAKKLVKNRREAAREMKISSDWVNGVEEGVAEMLGSILHEGV